MFCPKCGSKLPEDAAFCYACGAKIEIITPDEKPVAEPAETVGKKPGAGPNPKLIAAIAAVVVLVVVLVVAVGSCSSNGGSAASSSGASSAPSQEYSDKLGKLVALSNGELASTLESDGFTKSGDKYSKGGIEVELDDARGERIIAVDNATSAYKLLDEDDLGFDQLGAYFTSASNTEFSVGVCDVAGGKGVVVGSSDPSGCLVMVYEPGHFGSMGDIAKNVEFSNSMSAEEAAWVFVDGLMGNGFDHVDGDDIRKPSTLSTETPADTPADNPSDTPADAPADTPADTSPSEAAPPEAVPSAPESVAMHDDVTGKAHCNGRGAPDAVNTVSISDDEIIIVGKLSVEGLGAQSKTWSFGIDENTQFGAVMAKGFEEMPRDELIPNWESRNFPALVLELENGMVKRVYQSS